jgi:hypothetical protein
MSGRFHNRRRRAVTCRGRVEELEGRTLFSITASPAQVSEVEGQSSITLTILNLPGAVVDTSSKPTYTFSNAQVMNAADGTVSLSNTNDGAFTFTPAGSTFTGAVTISYNVSDGTGTSGSTVEIDIGPIAADPVTWGALSSATATIPSTTVPGLMNRIHDVSTNPTYSFTNAVVPAGDGTISNLNAATGSFTYTAASAMFTGTVAVQYSVSDGTNTTTGTVSIIIAPLITQPVAVTELDHQSTVSLTILNLTGAVQDISNSASYTFSDLRVIDGGGAIAAKDFTDSSLGSFVYALPAAQTPRPVHIGYTVSDGTNSANGIVTLQLVGIVTSSANFSVLQNTTSTLPPVAGRVVDVEADPIFTFSGPSVPIGDGTVGFTDTTTGVLSYVAPSPTFTGTFPVQYTVSDGTNSTSGVLNLTVAPLITSPLLIPAALQIQPTDIPSLVASGNVEDIAAAPTFTFSNPVVPPGDGTIQLVNATLGTFTYTPPSATFFGLVQVGYTVTDGAINTAAGSIIINVQQTIQPKNDGPITVVVAQANLIPASAIVGNDHDAPNGLPPSIGSVGNAVNGTVRLNVGGSVTFTPVATGPASFTYSDTDADSDASTTATVSLIVKLGTTIHWSDPADIIYGTPLSGTQLDATASVPGKLTYSPAAGTILHAGYYQNLVVNFTPNDSADYAGSTDTVTINVLQAAPLINWPSPGTIVYGTSLGASQLDAGANVPGAFTYYPGAGTVLPVGNGQTMAVVFTPSDSTDYSPSYTTTTINVQPAPPPGLTVGTHGFSGRVRKTLGGVIAQLRTTMPKLKTTYYSALVNWDDGVVQRGKLARSGTRGFKLNATHKYRSVGTYDVSVTIADPLGHSLTESFVVFVH